MTGGRERDKDLRVEETLLELTEQGPSGWCF